MNVAIVTDAWRPQTNGVVTTLSHAVECPRTLGHEVTMMTPDGLPTVPCPTHPEIRLALFQRRRVSRRLEHERPDALHDATEGPAATTRTRALATATRRPHRGRKVRMLK